MTEEAERLRREAEEETARKRREVEEAERKRREAEGRRPRADPGGRRDLHEHLDVQHIDHATQRAYLRDDGRG